MQNLRKNFGFSDYFEHIHYFKSSLYSIVVHSITYV